MSIAFILLGIAVIVGLMKSGEVSALGGCLMIFLLILVIAAAAVVALFTIGGAMF
jgi:hypothetical protein